MLVVLKHALVFVLDIFVLLAVAGWAMDFSQQTMHFTSQLSLVAGMGAALLAFAHLKFRHKLRG
jgi:hypothetical protein